MVGCVIVRDGRILGEGFHARAGDPHAEIAAAKAAGESNLSGSTVYVSLEPCCHQGKTPPCTDFLIAHGVARVVAAMEDPNPRVAGGGVAALRAAGVAVTLGVLEQEARKLNESFLKFIATGLPFVTAKCAMTLDGKIATRAGHSRWVTGEAARRKVHELRNECDAILVGSRTVMTDNPSLTTRLDGETAETRDPIRVILDAGEYLSEDRNIFTQSSPAPTWIAVTVPREYPAATEVIRVPKGPGGVDLRALLEELGRRGIMSLLIEGGGTTLASAFDANLVDKVWFFVAPKIVGGRDAITPVEGLGAETMAEAIPLESMSAVPVGEDLLIEAYVKRN